MTLQFAANLSMLYSESPFLDRFRMAAEAGFNAIEFHFPYEVGAEAVRARVEEYGLTVAVFNLPAGNADAGEWGTLGVPSRQDHFRRSFETALQAADMLNCKRIHALFGNRVEGLDAKSQFACALDNLSWAVPQATEYGITILVEALNPFDFPDYFLHTTPMAMDLVQQIDHLLVRLQLDMYHAQMTAGNLINTLKICFPMIGHVQIADVPGRHEPGTGEIRFEAILAALEDLGYSGYIGLEYHPLKDTDSSLAWLPRDLRGRNGAGRHVPGA